MRMPRFVRNFLIGFHAVEPTPLEHIDIRLSKYVLQHMEHMENAEYHESQVKMLAARIKRLEKLRNTYANARSPAEIMTVDPSMQQAISNSSVRAIPRAKKG